MLTRFLARFLSRVCWIRKYSVQVYRDFFFVGLSDYPLFWGDGGSGGETENEGDAGENGEADDGVTQPDDGVRQVPGTECESIHHDARLTFD